MFERKLVKIQKPWLRFLMIVMGFIAVALGMLGAFIPILPTTPFLLLASYLFMRSSQRFYRWLLTNRIFGHYIYNYIYHRAISPAMKIYTLALLWGAITLSCFWIKGTVWLQALLVVIAVAVTVHVVTLRNAARKQ